MASGHALSERADDPALAGAPMEVEIELAPPPISEVPAPSPAEKARAGAFRSPNAGHRHAYRTPLDHDARPHDPSIVHMVGPEPAPAVQTAPLAVETPVDEPLHFVLAPEGGLSMRGGATNAAQRGSTTTLGAIASAGSESDATFAESAVDAKAHLLSSVPVIYPEAARAAELEADVRLELVVDTEGRVVSARPLAPHDLGLDEAARRAVRAYRFSPARRKGRPIRVRMEWTVAFRLR